MVTLCEIPNYVYRLRLKLLAAWTTTLKRIGKRLIAFMLMVFKPVYKEDEVCRFDAVIIVFCGMPGPPCLSIFAYVVNR